VIVLLDIAWTAGFFEGEGCVSAAPHKISVRVSQVQREPLERLQAMFGGKIYRFEQVDRGVLRHYHRWDLNSGDAVGFMMTIYRFMSPKRKQQMRTTLTNWRATQPRERHRSHCPKGHPYDDTNTYIHPTSGSRQCIACRQRWGWYAKQKGA
jgi:hypothetical protein